MVIRRHGFSNRFIEAVEANVDTDAELTIVQSNLLSYLHHKMRAAERGSKSRLSLGNIYAIYCLVEDYREKVDHPDTLLEIVEYNAAAFADLFVRQRELFGGSKLQNHAYNHRCNMDFMRQQNCEVGPITRNQQNREYWINQNLLIVEVDGETVNISAAVIAVVEEYICALQEEFLRFIREIEEVIESNNLERAQSIVRENIGVNADARLFEITSFSIMHCYYSTMNVLIGLNENELRSVPLVLYKTGRTNANDGGIDFVLQPYGRFFQVTEDVDVTKWFLDIDKVARYPITFVVKDSRTPEDILLAIRESAEDELSADDVETMMECIEEVVNITNLISMFNYCVENELLGCVMNQVLEHSRVEFNIED